MSLSQNGIVSLPRLPYYCSYHYYYYYLSTMLQLPMCYVLVLGVVLGLK